MGKELLEDFLRKLRQIDTPVAPDMTAVGLKVLIGIILGVPVGAEVDTALIEEIGLTHSYPVEFGVAAEELR